MTFQRKGDAERWLALLEAEIVQGKWASPTARRVVRGDYADQWVRERQLQPRNRELYESLLRNHIRPYLGGRSLDKINSQAVRTWRKRLLDDGRTSIVAAKSYRLLRAVLNTAVNEDRPLSENPCRMRGYDKEETAERPVGSVSAVIELSELIGRRYRALVLFAAFTGLRWGEIVALRAVDLDLVQGTVRVARKFAELQDGRRVAGPPKSSAGVRTVALPAVLVQIARSTWATGRRSATRGSFVDRSGPRCGVTTGIGLSTGRISLSRLGCPLGSASTICGTRETTSRRRVARAPVS